MGILDGIVEWIAEQIMYGLDMINTSVLGALGCDMNTFLRYFPAAETMYSLLRLARAEQLLDIRHSVNRLVPASLRHAPTRRAKNKRQHGSFCPSQRRLAFGKQE